MKVKRYKRIRKYLQFYKVNFGIKAPFRLLVDTEFIQSCLEGRVQIKEQFPKMLQDEASTFTTACVHEDLRKKGKKYGGASHIAALLPTMACKHKKGFTSPTACIAAIVGADNAAKVIVGAQDLELRKVMREKACVPVLYMRASVPVMESPSDQTKAASVEQAWEATGPTESELKIASKLPGGTVLLPAQPKPIRKIREPNPLSVKKKKKKPSGKSKDGEQKKASTTASSASSTVISSSLSSSSESSIAVTDSKESKDDSAVVAAAPKKKRVRTRTREQRKKATPASDDIAITALQSSSSSSSSSVPYDDLAMAAEAAGESSAVTAAILSSSNIMSAPSSTSTTPSSSSSSSSSITGMGRKRKAAANVASDDTATNTTLTIQKNKKARDSATPSAASSSSSSPSLSSMGASSTTTIMDGSTNASINRGSMTRSSSLTLSGAGAASPLLTGSGGSSDQKRVLSLLRRLQPSDGNDTTA